jgi:pyrroloquinoline quinone (PQQ) biosynthesis protein C
MIPNRGNPVVDITPNSGWSTSFWNKLLPLKDQIVGHPIIQKFRDGSLPLEKIRNTLVRFYPVVKNFPTYMEANLRKIRSEHAGELQAKSWLTENIRVERNHARYWIAWGLSFGCTCEDFEKQNVSAEIKTLIDYLSEINTNASLVEGLAGTNLAIEWPTGEWVNDAREGMSLYVTKGVVTQKIKGMKWIREHCIHDEKHPYEAMELIKLCASSPLLQQKAFRAARGGMTYYLTALNASLLN